MGAVLIFELEKCVDFDACVVALREMKADPTALDLKHHFEQEPIEVIKPLSGE